MRYITLLVRSVDERADWLDKKDFLFNTLFQALAANRTKFGTLEKDSGT